MAQITVNEVYGELCDFLVALHDKVAWFLDQKDEDYEKFVLWGKQFQLPVTHEAKTDLRAKLSTSPQDQEVLRASIRAAAIAMPATMMVEMPEKLLSMYDVLLQQELAAASTTGKLIDALSLPRNNSLHDVVKEGTQNPNSTWLDHVRVWKGDMSLLRVSAMMNPADPVLLGCFEPGHKCLDNILHGASGPSLRIACHRLKADLKLSKDLPGNCRVTSGFNLPCDYVFHSIGPNLSDPAGGPPRLPTKEDEDALKSCYQACLDTAFDMKLESVAFCCIATGVFGYPNDAAAKVVRKQAQPE